MFLAVSFCIALGACLDGKMASVLVIPLVSDTFIRNGCVCVVSWMRTNVEAGCFRLSLLLGMGLPALACTQR